MLTGRAHARAGHPARATGGRAGRGGGLVLIGGAAGLGKTALAEEMGREAVARGAHFLIGRCYDHGETPPYGPWADCLDHPSLAPATPGLPSGRSPREAVVSGRMLARQVLDGLQAAAGGPLVLLLNDLHWADPASLDLLRLVCRHLAALPILVVATYRSDDLPRQHPLYAHLPALVREGGAVRLDLRPLGDEAVRAYVRERYTLAEADARRLLAYLAGRAEGTPFYLGELLRALVDEGALVRAGDGWAVGDLGAAHVPPLLRQLIDVRLARLGDEARGQLAVAAIIGQEVPLDLWARVSDADEEALRSLRERTSAARILDETPDGTTARFVHALIREALYAAILPSQRRRWHRRVAAVLTAAPVPEPDAIAHHFRQAGDPEALPWLLRAGERAYGAHAWLTAAERFAGALELMRRSEASGPERAALTVRLALLRRYAAPRESLRLLDEARRLAPDAGGTALDGATRCCQGLLHGYVGDYRRALAALREAVIILDAHPLAPIPADGMLPLDSLSARDLHQLAPRHGPSRCGRGGMGTPGRPLPVRRGRQRRGAARVRLPARPGADRPRQRPSGAGEAGCGAPSLRPVPRAQREGGPPLPGASGLCPRNSTGRSCPSRPTRSTSASGWPPPSETGTGWAACRRTCRRASPGSRCSISTEPGRRRARWRRRCGRRRGRAAGAGRPSRRSPVWPRGRGTPRWPPR